MAHRNTQMRDRIIRIAAGLFSSHGWEATTLEDILSTAGITKGAFYHYFPSKLALCEAGIDQAVSEIRLLFQTMDHRPPESVSCDSVLSRLEKFNRSEQKIWLRLLIRLSSDSNESFPSVHTRLRHFWNEFLRQIQSFQPDNDPRKGRIPATEIISRFAGSILLERYLTEQQK